MKNKSFFDRLKFALLGLKAAWFSENSFRSQIVLAGLALTTLIILKAKLFWWIIFILAIGSVLAAELINTSLEYILDALHPTHHPQIGKAKDCAAGAVLVLSFSSLLIFIFFLIDTFFLQVI